VIEWIKVRSSAIRKIGYESTSSRMFIDFEDSDPYYTFCKVPSEVFQTFVSSNSVGRHYHSHIKDRYDC